MFILSEEGDKCPKQRESEFEAEVIILTVCWFYLDLLKASRPLMTNLSKSQSRLLCSALLHVCPSSHVTIVFPCHFRLGLC